MNVFKLTAALWRQTGGAIGVQQDEFPTDGYILGGLSALTGAPLNVFAPESDPFSNNIQILVKSAVDYKTAAVADIETLEMRAAAANACIIWDLSHAAGLLPLDLARRGANTLLVAAISF